MACSPLTPSSLERRITGANDGPYSAVTELIANRAFMRNKLLAAISCAGAASNAIVEILRDGETVNAAVAAAETWNDGEPEPLGDDVVAQLADALKLAIVAQGLIEPHQRMFSAIERYQNGDD